MNKSYSATGLARTTAPTPRFETALNTFWAAVQAWRKRERVRAELSHLSDRELMDVGVTRGEIDYLASDRAIALDPLRWMSGIATRG